jgi:hypothetical protein
MDRSQAQELRRNPRRLGVSYGGTSDYVSLEGANSEDNTPLEAILSTSYAWKNVSSLRLTEVNIRLKPYTINNEPHR